MSAQQATPTRQAVTRTLAIIWIFGGAAYFYIRFSYIFYQSNRGAIEALLQRLSQALTIG